jgi:DNA-binding phage protein
MTTQPTSFLSDIVNAEEIPIGTRVYFQERMRNRLYSLVLSEFMKRQRSEGLTQAAIAKRLGKRPEQIHRYLSAPGNVTTDTLSDLLLAIAAAELDYQVSPLAAQTQTGKPSADIAEPNIQA